MTDPNTKIRLSENKATLERDKEEIEKARKNNGFTQLDDLGIAQLERVFEKSPTAGRLFLKLCQHMDSKGAVVASRGVLAEIAGVTTNNLSRLIKTLVDFGVIRDHKVKGTPIIAVNPDVAWRSWGSAKQYAVFNAKVIVDPSEFEDADDFDIRRAKAVLAMAKKRKGKSTDSRQLEIDPPVGTAPEDLEIVD